MASFTEKHGGGDVISTAQLQVKKQVRIVEKAETVEGFNDGDQPRVRLTFTPSDKHDGVIVFGNNAMRIALLKAIEADTIPDEMDEWRGLKVGLFAAKVQTPKGPTMARQLKVLGWDEDVRKSKPAAADDDDFDAGETDDEIPF